jgi:hypothetical protein
VIRVYFHCGNNVTSFVTPLVPVTRAVPRTPAVLQAVIDNLVTGPTEQERATGFTGAMPEELRNRILVRLHDGLAHIEIGYDTNTIGNFTTSNATAFFYESSSPTCSSSRQ